MAKEIGLSPLEGGRGVKSGVESSPPCAPLEGGRRHLRKRRAQLPQMLFRIFEAVVVGPRRAVAPGEAVGLGGRCDGGGDIACVAFELARKNLTIQFLRLCIFADYKHS